ncbi:MAG TPA: porin [Methylophilaceae bacterium]|nr:porin [Methylophilaceae bacterium]
MQFKKKIIASLLISGGVLGAAGQASANDSSELEQLRALVQELDQKVRVLARKEELQEEDLEKQKKETPKIKASASGFGLESADGKNSIKLQGLLQSDYRAYNNAYRDVRSRSDFRAGDLDNGLTGFSNTGDGWLIRRARPTVLGTLFGKYDYRFTEDFAGGNATVVDAYVDARFDPAFQVQVGKYKSQFSLERLQGGGNIKFIERSYVANDIAPNRDLGINLHGDVLDKKLSYSLAYNNGVQDGGNISTGTDFNGASEYTARLFTTPFKDQDSALSGLGFGLAATHAHFSGQANLNYTDTSAANGSWNGLPSYVSDGQNTVFRYNTWTSGSTPGAVADGTRFRLSPQANYYYGPFGLITEYVRISQGVSNYTGGSPAAGGTATDFVINKSSNKTLNHDAWQIAGSWLLTGEDASFGKVKPKQDFDLDKGGWGAWELVARYHELYAPCKSKAGTSYTQAAGAYSDLSKSVKSAHSYDLGVNWYLNEDVKVAVNYLHTTFEGGDIKPGTGANILANGSNVADRSDEQAIFARFQISY